jgi:hypothetical protein
MTQRGVTLPRWTPFKSFGAGRVVYVDPELSLGRYLYRYMPAKNAVRTLESGSLWFAAPSTWDDPHERWWCDMLFRKHTALAGVGAYGSCWTTRTHDEPFWRLYACACDPNAGDGDPMASLPAVRFRVRTQALLDWFCNSIGCAKHQCKGFAGVVRYCSSAQLAEVASHARAFKDNPSSLAAAGLHLKRRAFAFEDEVRLLLIDRQPLKPGIALPVDCTFLFDQVMIGPTNDTGKYLEVAALLKALGVPDDLVKPSSVYTLPRLNAVSARSRVRLLRSLGDEAQGGPQRSKVRSS